MKTLLILSISIFFSTPFTHAMEDPTPTVELGAEVYAKRCVLCHGSQAMGDGVLPLKMKNYPNTNLRKAQKAQSRKDIHEAVVYGGTHGKLSEFMPPFGKELSWTELESVTHFVVRIREDSASASELLAATMANDTSDRIDGRDIFSSRCVLCHGKFGEGDGRMSKLLKTPPPADLTASRMDRKNLEQIILLGGEGVGRSKHMPPWKDQLNKKEIARLIEYLISIRD